MNEVPSPERRAYSMELVRFFFFFFFLRVIQWSCQKLESKYYSRIYQERLKKATKKLCSDNNCPGRGLVRKWWYVAADWKCLTRVSAGTPNIMPEVLCSFPQSL
jgi:hypothetical protein